MNAHQIHARRLAFAALCLQRDNLSREISRLESRLATLEAACLEAETAITTALKEAA